MRTLKKLLRIFAKWLEKKTRRKWHRKKEDPYMELIQRDIGKEGK